MSLATQSHKHQAVGAKRDWPNMKPGNWAINIYTLRLGFTHSAASGARPAAEVQVLTVPLVVVQDFQMDHNPQLLSVPGRIHSQEGSGWSSSQLKGANASFSKPGVSAALDLPRQSPDQRSLAAQPAPCCCCEHSCSDAGWARA